MGWKSKRIGYALKPSVPTCEIRNLGLNLFEIYKCLAYENRLQGDFDNAVNMLSDGQVAAFTYKYSITPATRKGIILWRKEYLVNDIDDEEIVDYEEDEDEDEDEDEEN